MTPSPTRDLLVGLFVAAGLLAVGYLSISVGGFSIRSAPRNTLFASFDEVGDLKPRAQVVIGGVRVGEVDRIELDGDLRPRVALAIDADLGLPSDTSASIMTSGLLGDQYIALEPGAEEDLLGDGGEISFTQGAISIERLIGKLVQNLGVSN
jgi:phospholipid/cholesterol/gamma-HCH transport system substrate-binding protein